jgi:hypothetical protein
MVKSMKSVIGSTPIHDSHITLHVSGSRQLSLDDTRPRFMLPRFQPVVIALAGQHARLERAVERLF